MDRTELIRGSDFRRNSTLGLAISAVIILSPFAINNFLQQRILLGVGSGAIVVILAYNAWGLLHNRQSSLPTLLILVPSIIFFLVMSLHRQGVIGALWCFPAVLAFYIILPERRAWIANMLLLLTILPLCWYLLAHALALRVAATLTAVSIFSAIFIHAITDQQHKLSVVAATDALTGLLNRTRLDTTLEQAMHQASRSDSCMSLVALDIDNFKSINDTHGHHVGDEVLREVGKLLQQRLRGSDSVFRLGGEEFLALLFDTGSENARQVAEQLRLAIAEHHFTRQQNVTVSIGVATLMENESVDNWMRRADANLYKAKDQGKNCVVSSM